MPHCHALLFRASSSPCALNGCHILHLYADSETCICSPSSFVTVHAEHVFHPTHVRWICASLHRCYNPSCAPVASFPRVHAATPIPRVHIEHGFNPTCAQITSLTRVRVNVPVNYRMSFRVIYPRATLVTYNSLQPLHVRPRTDHFHSCHMQLVFHPPEHRANYVVHHDDPITAPPTSVCRDYPPQHPRSPQPVPHSPQRH